MVQTKITYQDGAVAIFDVGPGHDPIELDLDCNQDIFSVQVVIGEQVVFSAYHWHNGLIKE